MRVVAILWRGALTAVAICLLALVPANARDVFPGPINAVVERIIDGDTLKVRARIWIDQELSLVVRIRGIDAPETHAGCDQERNLARRAAAYLRSATESGEVTLTEISGGKYYGRVVARVTTSQGHDVAAALEQARLARPYEAGARLSWCPATN